MRNIRTCSHIKTNGTKCGSPALRHQTLCYFHYHWDRRERRRIRLGGPVGMNKNTGIDLPILEGPESIMLAIMEVQHALIDARIDRLTAHTLLYSLQLAMQLKIGSFSGLSSRLESVTTCPELEDVLELDRARGLRPPKEICANCPTSDTCTGPCHPERNSLAQPMSEAEGPFVSSPEATTPDSLPPLDTLPDPVVETRNLKLEASDVIANIQAYATPKRKQKPLRLRAMPPRPAQGDTSSVGQENRQIANPALKGGADHEPTLRHNRGLRMTDSNLVPRTSYLAPRYFDI